MSTLTIVSLFIALAVALGLLLVLASELRSVHSELAANKYRMQRLESVKTGLHQKRFQPLQPSWASGPRTEVGSDQEPNHPPADELRTEADTAPQPNTKFPAEPPESLVETAPKTDTATELTYDQADLVELVSEMLQLIPYAAVVTDDAGIVRLGNSDAHELFGKTDVIDYPIDRLFRAFCFPKDGQEQPFRNGLEGIDTKVETAGGKTLEMRSSRITADAFVVAFCPLAEPRASSDARSEPRAVEYDSDVFDTYETPDARDSRNRRDRRETVVGSPRTAHEAERDPPRDDGTPQRTRVSTDQPRRAAHVTPPGTPRETMTPHHPTLRGIGSISIEPSGLKED